MVLAVPASSQPYSLYYMLRALLRLADCPSLTALLLCMYKSSILIHMKTTLNIDDDLLEEARRLTNIEEKTALVRAGLEALISLESARRLAALGGTQPTLQAVPRRRSARKRR